MSLVTFLGIYFVRRAGIDMGTVGLAFLTEPAARRRRADVRRAPTASGAARC